MTTDHTATYTEIRELLRSIEPEKIAKAHLLLRQLAESGYVDAQTDLGFVLINGRADAASQIEAISWFEKAAGSGSPQAAFNLGALYQTGRGVSIDLEKARGYFAQAARALHPEGAYNYALLTRNLIGHEGDLAEAVSLIENVAEKSSDGAAYYAVGLAALEGWVGEKDMTKGIAAFEKAVEAGHVSAAYNLGIVFYYGNEVVPADRAKAKVYLELAASRGHERAKKALKDITLTGLSDR